MDIVLENAITKAIARSASREATEIALKAYTVIQRNWAAPGCRKAAALLRQAAEYDQALWRPVIKRLESAWGPGAGEPEVLEGFGAELEDDPLPVWVPDDQGQPWYRLGLGKTNSENRAMELGELYGCHSVRLPVIFDGPEGRAWLLRACKNLNNSSSGTVFQHGRSNTGGTFGAMFW